MKSILKKRDFRVAAGCNIVSEATRDFFFNLRLGNKKNLEVSFSL